MRIFPRTHSARLRVARRYDSGRQRDCDSHAVADSVADFFTIAEPLPNFFTITKPVADFVNIPNRIAMTLVSNRKALPSTARRMINATTFLAVIILASCSGNGESTTCPAVFDQPVQPDIQLVYPVPNATNVPDQPGSIVIAFSFSEYVTDGLTLASRFAPVNLGRIDALRSPLPSPAATPGFPNPLYYGVSTPQLHAATTYTVNLTPKTTSPCSWTASLGSFTTQ